MIEEMAEETEEQIRGAEIGATIGEIAAEVEATGIEAIEAIEEVTAREMITRQGNLIK